MYIWQSSWMMTNDSVELFLALSLTAGQAGVDEKVMLRIRIHSNSHYMLDIVH